MVDIQKMILLFIHCMCINWKFLKSIYGIMVPAEPSYIRIYTDEANTCA